MDTERFDEYVLGPAFSIHLPKSARLLGLDVSSALAELDAFLYSLTPLEWELYRLGKITSLIGEANPDILSFFESVSHLSSIESERLAVHYDLLSRGLAHAFKEASELSSLRSSFLRTPMRIGAEEHEALMALSSSLPPIFRLGTFYHLIASIFSLKVRPLVLSLGALRLFSPRASLVIASVFAGYIIEKENDIGVFAVDFAKNALKAFQAEISHLRYLKSLEFPFSGQAGWSRQILKILWKGQVFGNGPVHGNFIMNAIALDEREAKKALKDLIDQGLIAKVGDCYQLSC